MTKLTLQVASEGCRFLHQVPMNLMVVANEYPGGSDPGGCIEADPVAQTCLTDRPRFDHNVPPDYHREQHGA